VPSAVCSPMTGTLRTPAPQRTCIGCRRVTGRDDLVRVARRPDGSLGVGPSEPGRGAWLCAQETCFEMAVRRRAFGRALRREIAPAEVAELRERLFPG
jgi:predicted RNA-binding protein YlxR (DUF448 family)